MCDNELELWHYYCDACFKGWFSEDRLGEVYIEHIAAECDCDSEIVEEKIKGEFA